MRPSRKKTHALQLEALEKRDLFAFSTGPGVGWEAEGADLEYADLNNNGIKDVIAMAYDAPSGPNQFRYRIGYDVDRNGAPRYWSDVKFGPSMGWEGQGAGLAVTNLDGDSQPDVVFMAYDDPAGPNNFRYVVGYDMNAAGFVSSWSQMQSTPGLGWEADGAGLAIRNLDANPRPDAILMAYDDPAGANTFRYKVGYNLDSLGRPQFWSAPIVVPGLGSEGAGAGIELGNLDNNPRPDAVFMAYDDPSGANTFRLKVAYNLSPSGQAQSWGTPMEVSGLGSEADGAGVALQDLDRDGDDEFVFMAYDDPRGANEFRFLTQEATTSAAIVGSELVVNAGIRGGKVSVAQWYGNSLVVAKSALNGVREYSYVPASNVQSIRINGSEAADQLYNYTNIPSTLIGNGMNDWLFGGSRDDHLEGGDGIDALYGGAGNDHLYGGAGLDFLFGQAGNDGLFGGIQSKDLLFGGDGADRFLQPQEEYRFFFGLATAQRDEDVLADFNRANDAELEFWADEKRWTDDEIQRVDDAFALLHELTDNTRLLKDSVRDDSLRFYRYSSNTGCGPIACNYGGNHHIFIGDGTFTHWSGQRWTVQSVIHELAHNWDEPNENPFVPAFRAESVWVNPSVA